MTTIDFYHNAPDRIAAACNLAAQLYREGRKVIVYSTDPTVLDRIDRQLWAQPSISFIPHAKTNSPLATETPILLGAHSDIASHEDILLNLDHSIPQGFSRFAQLIEIVSQQEEDKHSARIRFKQYREQGYPLTAHDLGEPS